MKICSRCKISKKLIDFSIDKSRQDGLYPLCKMCHHKDNEILRTETHIAVLDKLGKECNICGFNDVQALTKRPKHLIGAV